MDEGSSWDSIRRPVGILLMVLRNSVLGRLQRPPRAIPNSLCLMSWAAKAVDLSTAVYGVVVQ